MGWKQNTYSNVKFFQIYSQSFLFKRWKSRSAANKKKVTSTDKALEYFDDFYGNIYKKIWPSMRLALLSTQKYIAIVNNFSDTERIINDLESLGAVNIRQVYEIQARKLKESKMKDYGHTNLEAEILNRMQKFSERKREEELTSIYPTNKAPDNASSLDKKISSEDRLIEPSVGMSASALFEYVPPSKLKGMEDWVPESEHYTHYADSQDYPISTIEQNIIEFPLHLHAYTLELANVEQFPSPKKGTTGVSDYYLLNGGSLLPILALDLKAGDNVLDLCAAPGGKGLLCLQTLLPKTILLNDVSESRINKTKKVMKEFFYDFDQRNKNGDIIIAQTDGRYFNVEDTYNKILVDVPCTTDRHSVIEDENNIFKAGRIKERIKMPELQSELLINALKIVKVGGTVVYSTCSLSPTQNDGVVAFAMRKLSEQTDNRYIVVDMKKALKPLDIFYNFENSVVLRCGHLVAPYLPANFGPTYVCKIVRLK